MCIGVTITAEETARMKKQMEQEQRQQVLEANMELKKRLDQKKLQEALNDRGPNFFTGQPH